MHIALTFLAILLEGLFILTQSIICRRTSLGGMEATTIFKVIKYMFAGPICQLCKKRKTFHHVFIEYMFLEARQTQKANKILTNCKKN